MTTKTSAADAEEKHVIRVPKPAVLQNNQPLRRVPATGRYVETNGCHFAAASTDIIR